MIFWGTKWFLNIDKLKGESLLEINGTSTVPRKREKEYFWENMKMKIREKRETKKCNYTTRKVVNFSNCQRQ